MKKGDSPPKGLYKKRDEHLDKVFEMMPSLPVGTAIKLYNAYRLAKKEHYKLKKYRKDDTKYNSENG